MRTGIFETSAYLIFFDAIVTLQLKQVKQQASVLSVDLKDTTDKLNKTEDRVSLIVF